MKTSWSRVLCERRYTHIKAFLERIPLSKRNLFTIIQCKRDAHATHAHPHPCGIRDL